MRTPFNFRPFGNFLDEIIVKYQLSSRDETEGTYSNDSVENNTILGAIYPFGGDSAKYSDKLNVTSLGAEKSGSVRLYTDHNFDVDTATINANNKYANNYVFDYGGNTYRIIEKINFNSYYVYVGELINYAYI